MLAYTHVASNCDRSDARNAWRGMTSMPYSSESTRSTVARATVDRVDSDEYGMLVMPRHAFLASLLSQFEATCVYANKSRHRVACFAPLVPLLIAEHMAIVSRDWSVDTHLFGGSVHSRRGSP